MIPSCISIFGIVGRTCTETHAHVHPHKCAHAHTRTRAPARTARTGSIASRILPFAASLRACRWRGPDSVCSLLFFFLFCYWAWGVTGARSLGTSFLRLIFFFFLFSFFQTALAGRPNRAQPLLRQFASCCRVWCQHGRPVAGSDRLHICPMPCK